MRYQNASYVNPLLFAGKSPELKKRKGNENEIGNLQLVKQAR
jgi:hypothetical protein